jgi:hypothetical protein
MAAQGLSFGSVDQSRQIRHWRHTLEKIQMKIYQKPCLAMWKLHYWF